MLWTASYFSAGTTFCAALPLFLTVLANPDDPSIREGRLPDLSGTHRHRQRRYFRCGIRQSIQKFGYLPEVVDTIFAAMAGEARISASDHCADTLRHLGIRASASRSNATDRFGFWWLPASRCRLRPDAAQHLRGISLFPLTGITPVH